MTDYNGVAPSFSGTALTEVAGTGAADTVPAGALILWRNTGAGAHVVTLTTNNTFQGLAIADQPVNLTAGQIKLSRVAPEWGDANGRVQVAIDGTAAEVKYYLMGNV